MADIFDVIADGTRRDILAYLRAEASSGESGTSVSQIVHELGVSQPTVSKHLKVLREAELVSVREEGQHRFYSLVATPLEAVEDWLTPFLWGDLEELSERAAAEQTPLPEPAAHAADVVGRAAASAVHAVQNVLGRIPGR